MILSNIKKVQGSYYSGISKKGKKHEKEKLFFQNGEAYEGDFDNEKMTGWGLHKRIDVKNHFIEEIEFLFGKIKKFGFLESRKTR